MSHIAIIDGKRYTFIESLSGIDTEGETVICQNENGIRFACSHNLWRENIANEFPSFSEAQITNKSSSKDKIALFRSLFCGRNDIYAKRWYNPKTGQSGYSPACKNEWVRGVCNKKAVSCGHCQNRDLIDIHIKMLERMYHKRLHGYAELGYQAKAGETSKEISVIFDNHSFYKPFAADITGIEHEVLIISPFVRKARVKAVINLLEAPLRRRAKITVITRPYEDYKLDQQAEIAILIADLQTAGITVIVQSGIHQKYAVFDKMITWYGSINFLSFGSSQESIMRFENADLAGELLDSAILK